MVRVGLEMPLWRMTMVPGGEREARAKSRSLTPFAKCASGFGMTAGSGGYK
jgi:hypothetical protein